MDEFERRLQIELALALDQVVTAPPPRRRHRPQVRVLTGGLEDRPAESAIAPETASVATPPVAPVS